MLPQQDPNAGGPAVAADSQAHPPGLIDDVVGLAREFQAMAQDQLELVALEAKFAGRNLMTMLAAAIGLGILVTTVWLGLIASVVWWFIEMGAPRSAALLVMAAVNLIAAFVCYRVIRRSIRSFGFPATLRSLRAASLQHRNGTST